MQNILMLVILVESQVRLTTEDGLRNFIGKAKSKISLTIILIAIFAFVFGMHGGTPIEHGDNLAPKAKRTVRNFGNPRFFTYPALMLYMNASVYIVYELALEVLPEKISRTLDKWPYRDIPGHLLTTLFSIIGAMSVFGICSILTKSSLFSTIGALLLITSPLWNANSHYITVDIPLAALCMLTVFVLLYFLEKKYEIKVQYVIFLGFLIGLAASAKYNGALVASAVIAAILIRVKPLMHGLKFLVICGFFAIGTFLAVNPFILFNFHDFVQDFLYASKIVAIGHPGFMVTAFHHHLSESLYLGWNFGPILLSVFGIIIVITSSKLKLHSKLAILVFPFIHLIVLLRTKMTFHRYVLPLMPFLAVFASYALFKIGQYIKSRYHTNLQSIFYLIMSVATLCVLGVNSYQSLRHNSILQKVDTRTILGDRFSANSTEISDLKIGAGSYCMNFLGDSAKLKTMNWVRNSDVDITGDYDIIVIDSFTHDRYITDENMRMQIDFSMFSKGHLISVSPYKLKNKAAVPFSPMSMYSPYYPDLPFRTNPGPYIEIYIANPQLAQSLSQTLTRNGIFTSSCEISRGYYFRMFSKDGSREGIKSLSEQSKQINQRFSELFQKRKSGTL